jgi:hypothetical protein
MLRIKTSVVIAAVSYLAAIHTGCGDYAQSTQFEVMQTNSTAAPRLSLDASKIPPDWIESRNVHSRPWGTEETIKLKFNRGITIILAPTIEPGDLAPSTRPTAAQPGN